MTTAQKANCIISFNSFHQINFMDEENTNAYYTAEIIDKTKMSSNDEYDLTLQLVEENNNIDGKNVPSNEKNENELNGEIQYSEMVVDSSDEDGDDKDGEDLTSLTWLTELKNLTNLPPTNNDVEEKPCDPPSQRFDKFINQVHKIKENYMSKSEDYQAMSEEKPPYNYAQIIAMAMLEEGRMTLKQICDWIESHFAYYRYHKNWNNSIRHNLSLNFFFSKVARGKDEKGKGGYWELAVDSAKTSRKRVRNRKKKNCIISRNGKVTRFRKTHAKKIDILSKSSYDTGMSDFISSPSNINENSNLSTSDQIITEIEVVEEQQNINNIIDHIDQNAIIIANDNFESPNVIVETIPTYQYTNFNQINFDENDLSEIICFNDQELIDDFLNYSNNETEEFM